MQSKDQIFSSRWMWSRNMPNTFHKPVKPLLALNYCQMFRSNIKNTAKRRQKIKLRWNKSLLHGTTGRVEIRVGCREKTCWESTRDVPGDTRTLRSPDRDWPTQAKPKRRRRVLCAGPWLAGSRGCPVCSPRPRGDPCCASPGTGFPCPDGVLPALGLPCLQPACPVPCQLLACGRLTLLARYPRTALVAPCPAS